MKNIMQGCTIKACNRPQQSIYCCFIALGLWCAPSLAEEGGSGHYLPGSMASFMDTVPLTETFLVRLNVVNYEGSRSIKDRLPISGNSVLGADASSWAYGLTMLWRPPLELGGNWSYAMSATLPYVTMDVSGEVEVTGATNSASVHKSDSDNGLGDAVLIPLMLGYKVNQDFNVNFRVTAYAPTGDYEVGRLANTGKNFWTWEPTMAFMYMGAKNGIEASLFAGLDINQENKDTHYKSGEQFHLDGTIAQHFPYFGGLSSVGLTGYYYEQISDDSGSGATFGAFRAKTVGVGPVISYVGKIDGNDLLAELKWMKELETKNRLEGDTLFLKVALKF